MYDLIMKWYKCGIWTSTHVTAAVSKGWITQAEADGIAAAGQTETGAGTV